MNDDRKDLNKLIKNRDIYKALLICAFILWPCILIAAIYFYSKKGSIALFIPVFTLIAVFVPVYMQFRSLNAEVKSKGQGKL